MHYENKLHASKRLGLKGTWKCLLLFCINIHMDGAEMVKEKAAALSEWGPCCLRMRYTSTAFMGDIQKILTLLFL